MITVFSIIKSNDYVIISKQRFSREIRQIISSGGKLLYRNKYNQYIFYDVLKTEVNLFSDNETVPKTPSN